MWMDPIGQELRKNKMATNRARIIRCTLVRIVVPFAVVYIAIARRQKRAHRVLENIIIIK